MTSRHRHGCTFCVALQRLAIRRRGPALAEAAILLRETHAANDADRLAFARSGAQRTRLGNAVGGMRTKAGSELPISAVTSKTEVCRARRDA